MGVPVCSAHDAPVLLGAGLADHRLQAVELGEPRSVLLQKDLHGIALLGLQVLLMEELAIEHVPGHELACGPGEAAGAVD